MRRFLPILTLALAVLPLGATPAAQRSASRPATPAMASMLTVDSIMRGPKLVGSAPAGVRWSKDSSKVYFNWQKPEDTRPATYAINRDGGGLRKMTDEEARTL